MSRGLLFALGECFAQEDEDEGQDKGRGARDDRVQQHFRPALPIGPHCGVEDLDDRVKQRGRDGLPRL